MTEIIEVMVWIIRGKHLDYISALAVLSNPSSGRANDASYYFVALQPSTVDRLKESSRRFVDLDHHLLTRQPSRIGRGDAVVLALHTRCSNNATSGARACELRRAGLTGETEEGAMRGCLGVLGVESAVVGDASIGRGGHGRDGDGVVSSHVALRRSVGHGGCCLILGV